MKRTHAITREEKIRTEVKKAIEHADRAKASLLTWLNNGTEELASKAYAIKCRVKDENSLVRKVIYKIEEEKKTNYSAKVATDIIGLRLLALNNDQLSNLVEGFVRFVLFCQKSSTGLIVGNKPYQAFEQIKIFKSHNNAFIYDEIKEHLISRGLQDRGGKPAVELYDATNDDPYSSVHFVCRIKDPQSTKSFPLEVQIRTVFEDAWAEIEHPLRYKGTSYYKEESSADYENLKQIADLFLIGLKQNLDHSLIVAGHIQSLYLNIESIFGRRALASSIRFTPFGGHLNSKAILDSSMPTSVAREISKDVDKEIENVLSAWSDSPLKMRVESRIDDILRNLDQIDVSYRTKYPERHDGDSKFGFYYRMEKAFLYVLKQKVRSSKSSSLVLNPEFGLKALDLYQGLDQDARNSKQALLKFRLAMAAQIVGKAELAQDALYQANKLLPSDSTIPPDHALQIAIPRQYSLSLWLRKQQKWHEWSRDGEGHLVGQQIDILRNCLKLTKGCLKVIDRIKKTPEKEIELMRLYNNFISYVWELQDLGDQVKLDADEREYVKAFLPKLDKAIDTHDVEGFTRMLSGIDTALKASVLLNDSEKKEKYKHLLQNGLDAEDQAPASAKEHTEEEIKYIKYCLGRATSPEQVLGVAPL